MDVNPDVVGVEELQRVTSANMPLGRQMKLFVSNLQKIAAAKSSRSFTLTQLEKISHDMGMRLPNFAQFLHQLSDAGSLLMNVGGKVGVWGLP
jgi:hypothetical protein